jgi:hypothetical protein
MELKINTIAARKAAAQQSEMLPSAVSVLRQMQPDTVWHERRLEAAVKRIEELERELRDEQAAHLRTFAAYGKLAWVTRSYRADPCPNGLALLDFYLMKAPGG